MAEDTARRHPAIFLGAAFLAGAVLARFLRSSSEHQHRQQHSEQTSSASFLENETEAESAVPPPASINPNQPARMADVDPTLPPASPSPGEPSQGTAPDLGEKPYDSSGPAGEEGERP